MDNKEIKEGMKRFESFREEYKIKIDGSTDNIAERLQQRTANTLSKAMEKYMPIGSVVRVKETGKNYMIIGFNTKEGEKTSDYLGCEYPYGVDEEHSQIRFNHEQIEKVFHIGFVNNQEKAFKEQLNPRKPEIDEEER